jgi:hypothetical protein
MSARNPDDLNRTVLVMSRPRRFPP